jgi:activator of 2-hydroxyglutaryl-CoA dehydratase
MYKHLPENVTIAKACTTGYGEHLIKSALKADLGEVEIRMLDHGIWTYIFTKICHELKKIKKSC